MMTVGQLRQLEQSATPGPWKGRAHDGRSGGIPFTDYTVTADQPPCTVVADVRDGGCPDAELIAAMRNVFPALLDIAEAAQHVLDHGRTSGNGTPVLTKPLMGRLAAALSRLEGDNDE